MKEDDVTDGVVVVLSTIGLAVGIAGMGLLCARCGWESPVPETAREERVGLGAWSEEWREAREWQVVKLEAERRGE